MEKLTFKDYSFNKMNYKNSKILFVSYSCILFIRLSNSISNFDF